MKRNIIAIFILLGTVFSGRAIAEEEGHASEGHEEHGDRVELTQHQIQELGIVIDSVGPGQLNKMIEVPGEIRLNGDRTAHIIPRVPGVVARVHVKLGDVVPKGKVLAELNSKELANSKASFLAATERLGLAKSTFIREERLWKKKISPEQEYLDAKRSLAEARIEVHKVEQTLYAIGFTEKDIKDIGNNSDASFTHFEIISPFEGTIVEKHITNGEVLHDDTVAFIIADLNTVWVDLQIYQKDLYLLKKGQEVFLSTNSHLKERGEITFLSPIVNESTRTVLARVELPNPDGNWRPGLFVTGRVAVGEMEVPVLVPQSAIQNFEGNTVVFIFEEGGFEPRPVTLGKSDGRNVEILSGITLGQKIATLNTFTLKAELGKSELSSGHSH